MNKFEENRKVQSQCYWRRHVCTMYIGITCKICVIYFCLFSSSTSFIGRIWEWWMAVNANAATVYPCKCNTETLYCTRYATIEWRISILPVHFSRIFICVFFEQIFAKWNCGETSFFLASHFIAVAQRFDRAVLLCFCSRVRRNTHELFAHF